MSHNITVEGGSSVRLPTAGKYCDRDIVITATGGGVEPTGTVNITENGTHNVAQYASAMVNVPIPDGYLVPSGTLEVVENGTHDAKAFESVSVNVPIPDGYIQPSGTLAVTENGTHDVTQFASVNVDVPSKEPILQEKTATENGEVTADSGYDGLSKVIVNVESGGGGESPTALLDAALNGSLTSIDSTITSVAAYACRGFSKLKTVNLPNATSIGTYAFYYCTVMTSINAPKVTSLGTYAFYNTKLARVNFPLVTTIAQNSFYTCKSLEIADFGVAGAINQAAFAYCSNLKALILRKSDGICKLATATNALQGTPIAAGTGYVYVPAALVESYKTATNWSGYADLGIFRAIEDYPDICG